MLSEQTQSKVVAGLLLALILVLTVWTGIRALVNAEREKAVELAEVARVSAESRAQIRQAVLTASITAAQTRISELESQVREAQAKIRQPWKPTTRMRQLVRVDPVVAANVAAEVLTDTMRSPQVSSMTGTTAFEAKARLVEGRALVTVTATEALLLADVTQRLPIADDAATKALAALESERWITVKTEQARQECEDDGLELRKQLKILVELQRDGTPSFWSTTMTAGGLTAGVILGALGTAIAIGSTN